MADPTFPLIPLLSFLSLLMTITPFAYISFRDHTGIVMFMIWQSVNCIQTLVNRILWFKTVDDLAPLWCDISTKFEVGKVIGVPASVLCMMRGIYRVVQMENHFDSSARKRRMVWESLAIALLFPIVVVSLQPLVSGRRYVIVEDFGCTGWAYSDWLTLVLYSMWPFVLSVLTFIYCALTMHKCWKMSRGRMFTGQSELNRFVFSRTLVCAGVTLITLLPICAYNLVYQLRLGVAPYPGLSEIIKYRSRKSVFVIFHSHNSMKWDTIQIAYVSAVEHLLPSLCFFLIFGTGNVAVGYYSRVISRISTRLGLNRTTMQGGTAEGDMEFAARPGSITDSKATTSSTIEEACPAENWGGPSCPSRNDRDDSSDATPKPQNAILEV